MCRIAIACADEFAGVGDSSESCFADNLDVPSIVIAFVDAFVGGIAERCAVCFTFKGRFACATCSKAVYDGSVVVSVCEARCCCKADACTAVWMGELPLAESVRADGLVSLDGLTF